METRENKNIVELIIVLYNTEVYFVYEFIKFSIYTGCFNIQVIGSIIYLLNWPIRLHSKRVPVIYS